MCVAERCDADDRRSLRENTSPFEKKGKTKGPREGGGGEGGECGELSDSSTHFKSESSLFCCVFSDPHSAINMIMDREN